MYVNYRISNNFICIEVTFKYIQKKDTFCGVLVRKSSITDVLLSKWPVSPKGGVIEGYHLFSTAV